jgi:Rod binding domain-containing protein
MDIASISAQLQPTDLGTTGREPDSHSPEAVAKVSKGFESILVRQFLQDSMKPLLQDGESGQVYGYMLTDSLANEISKGGGLGLAHVLQTQISKIVK